ncbi:MAG: NAAT family transporter [Candidatus Methanofastidiosa archaeon]|nr:NAAT family transporter [Candidatus Methanofastidiosa archaeon]
MTIINEFIKTFIPLFIILNPLAIIPNYMVVVEHIPKREAERFSSRTIISAFILLAIFIFIGRPFLDLIGISTYSFMIACGLLLLYISMGMLSGDPPITRNVSLDSTSIVPMSIPLLAGPGSIATTIVLENNYGISLVFVSLVVSMLVSKILLDNYQRIYKVLGTNGLNAWIRLSALFYSAIAISLITNGILSIGG